MKPVPILFLSDAPDLPSGLARIGRDLATLLTRSPYFRVGALGWGMTGARTLPFTCYNMQLNEWGERSLQRVWHDFAGEQRGVVFSIWDLSRLLWLTQPQFLTDEHQHLREWLQHRPFQIWSYLPIDSVGPQGKLTDMSRAALLGIDRVLAYTPFGENVIRATIGEQEAGARRTDWLPHALDGDTWTSAPRAVYTLNTRVHAGDAGGQHARPGDARTRREWYAQVAAEGEEFLRASAVGQGAQLEGAPTQMEARVAAAGAALDKAAFEGRDATVSTADWDSNKYPTYGSFRESAHITGITDELSAPVRIGVVATNQARKDWGLAAEVCAAVRQRIAPRALKLWWHVDQEIRDYSIPALLTDFGLMDACEVTSSLDDAQMAEHYRACDVTLGIGGGEGFGFPIFESLMCGVPCVHGDYAGGASIMQSCGLSDLLVAPVGFRLETQSNCYRPVFRVEDWVERILNILIVVPRTQEWYTERVAHLQWRNLWPRWQHWFEDGLR